MMVQQMALQILLKKLLSNVDKIIFHKRNFGKGAAIISAKKFIKGNYVIIQDADLEYNPQDYKKILNAMLDKKLQSVYGSRVLGKKDTQLKILHQNLEFFLIMF